MAKGAGRWAAAPEDGNDGGMQMTDEVAVLVSFYPPATTF